MKGLVDHKHQHQGDICTKYKVLRVTTIEVDVDGREFLEGSRKNERGYARASGFT